jgi:hypothetical protein
MRWGPFTVACVLLIVSAVLIHIENSEQAGLHSQTLQAVTRAAGAGATASKTTEGKFVALEVGTDGSKSTLTMSTEGRGTVLTATPASTPAPVPLTAPPTPRLTPPAHTMSRFSHAPGDWTSMPMHRVSQATIDSTKARCVDGSAPAYNLRTNAASSVWVLFLEGCGFTYGTLHALDGCKSSCICSVGYGYQQYGEYVPATPQSRRVLTFLCLACAPFMQAASSPTILP